MSVSVNWPLEADVACFLAHALEVSHLSSLANLICTHAIYFAELLDLPQ